MKSCRLAPFLAALSLVMAAPAALAQTVLKYSNWLPPKHNMHLNVFVPWMAEVEKATEGRVKFEVLPKPVGTVPSQFDVGRDGLADVVLFVPGFSPGRFELIDVVELPLLGDEAAVVAPATYRLYKKHLEKYNEFKGVHVLSVFTTTSGHIYTSKKPVKSMADMKGLKMRTSIVSTIPTLNAMGAVAVSKSPSEIYELVSTGILDGTLLSREGVVSFNLVDILNNLTVIPGGIYNSAFVLAVNDDKWSSISPKDRDTISRLSGEAIATAVGKSYSKADSEALEVMKAAKKNVIFADAAFQADLRRALVSVEPGWIAKAKKKGMSNPEAVLSDFKAEVAAGQKIFASK